MSQRDEMIIREYLEGRDMHALEREHGIQQRRIYQILRASGVTEKRVRKTDSEKSPLSKVHKKIGNRVYEYYFSNDMSRRQAANQIGVSMNTLRNIELGRHRLDLFDLQDIASFLKTTVGDLLNEC